MSINTVVAGTYQTGSVNYSSIYSGIIRVTVNSTDIANNKSNITVTWFYRKNAGDPYGSFNGSGSSRLTLNINGTESVKNAANFDLRSANVGSEQVLHSVTTDVIHESDGSKSILISGSHYTGLSWGTKDIAAAVVHLPTIPRTADFTIGQPVYNLTDMVTITVHSLSNSFNYWLQIFAPSNGYAEADKNKILTKTFTLPIDWALSNPNGVSFTATARVSTWTESGQLIGYIDKTFTVQIPFISQTQPYFESLPVVPTPNLFNYTAIKGLTGFQTTTINPSAKYGAGIAKISYTASNGWSHIGSVWDSPKFPSAGNLSVTGTVTDTRGFTFSRTTSIDVQDYFTPFLSVAESWRVNSEGEYSPSGDRITVIANAVIASVSGNNNLEVLRYRYKPVLSADWSSWSNLSNMTHVTFLADIDLSYDIQIEWKDSLSASLTRNLLEGSSVSLLDFKGDGTGVAIGKSSEISSALELNPDWKLIVKGKELKQEFVYYAGEETFTTDSNGDILFHNGDWFREKLQYTDLPLRRITINATSFYGQATVLGWGYNGATDTFYLKTNAANSSLSVFYNITASKSDFFN